MFNRSTCSFSLFNPPVESLSRSLFRSIAFPSSVPFLTNCISRYFCGSSPKCLDFVIICVRNNFDIVPIYGNQELRATVVKYGKFGGYIPIASGVLMLRHPNTRVHHWVFPVSIVHLDMGFVLSGFLFCRTHANSHWLVHAYSSRSFLSARFGFLELCRRVSESSRSYISSSLPNILARASLWVGFLDILHCYIVVFIGFPCILGLAWLLGVMPLIVAWIHMAICFRIVWSIMYSGLWNPRLQIGQLTGVV